MSLDPSQKQCILDVAANSVFVATLSPMHRDLTTLGISAKGASAWLLLQTDDPNKNGDLFFQAMFGKPDGVLMAIRQLGQKHEDRTQEQAASAVLEARIVTDAAPDAALKLRQLGFREFDEFTSNDQVLSAIERLKIEFE